jgi:hypothetical protein
MRLLQKIERLQKKAGEAKAVRKGCPHVYTLKMYGEITSDPPPCRCGGERVTISVVHVKQSQAHSLARESMIGGTAT